jgi:mRNA-degrading endonuclease RelE of RelBE toxin-antitoxin system
MVERYDVEIEPEVQQWLDALPPKQYVAVERRVDRLADNPAEARMPLFRPLGDKVAEIRMSLGDAAVRITYWVGPGRRVILLTVFTKTRDNEAAEVARAKRAQEDCQNHHAPAADHAAYDRTFKEGELS